MRLVMMGAIAMAFALASLFFLRFWRDTRDRLFGYFALAFAILALNRVALALVDPGSQGDYFYWVRFTAFAILLLAIWDKNRVRTPGASP
jgi:hypothetical protein